MEPDLRSTDYFERIEEPIRAYVAGLLAADGNVLERKRRITLELSVRDVHLVHLVRDELAPGFPARHRVRPNGRESVVLAITSNELCAGLAGLGITPRKSLTLKWPQDLNNVSVRAFLLGYFDGDGFITWSRTGPYVYPRWGLCGKQAFLSSAMQLIHDEAGVPPRRPRSQTGKKMHVLAIGGADAFLVDKWIHFDETLGLDRKRLSLHGPSQADSPANSSRGT